MKYKQKQGLILLREKQVKYQFCVSFKIRIQIFMILWSSFLPAISSDCGRKSASWCQTSKTSQFPSKGHVMLSNSILSSSINQQTPVKYKKKNVNHFDVVFFLNIPETEIILTNAKLVGATSLSMLNMTCKIAMLLVFRALDSSLKTVCFKRVGMFSLWALHNSRMH